MIGQLGSESYIFHGQKILWRRHWSVNCPSSANLLVNKFFFLTSRFAWGNCWPKSSRGNWWTILSLSATSWIQSTADQYLLICLSLRSRRLINQYPIYSVSLRSTKLMDHYLPLSRPLGSRQLVTNIFFLASRYCFTNCLDQSESLRRTQSFWWQF